MQENRNIILFDGVCNLCNRAVIFIIKHDPEGRFAFASIQSGFAEKLIVDHYPESFDFDSILLFKGSVYFERSDAAMEIARDLRGCRFAFLLLKITPKPIRDFFYSIIARHRYRIFGKRSECMIPTQDIQNRFIDA